MNEPDLKLGGLSLWVLGRAHADASDFWDGNWLAVRAAMQVASSSVTIEGPLLMVNDFERFRSELEQVYDTHSGEAALAGHEPNLRVTLRAEGHGQITGQIEITPDQMSEFHRFEVGFDQTYLPPLIASCGAIVERFPAIGQSDG